MNKPTLKEQAHGEIEKIFRILLPQNGLSVREEQITLCHAMLDTLLKNNIALCDAGVGIGKTYAYLTACILLKKFAPHGPAGSQPVVISTSSVALQDSIIEEYIPFLSRIFLENRVISKPIRAIVRKGKERFVCDARLSQRLEAVKDKNKNAKQLKALLGVGRRKDKRRLIMKKKRYLPFGYQMNEGNIIPDILESSAVQSIFENYRNGASLQMLAKQMQQSGLKYRENAVWNKAMIARILDCEKYISEEFPAILPSDLFLQVQRLRKDRAQIYGGSLNPALRGIRDLICCQTCGQKLVRINHRDNVYIIWKCPSCNTETRYLPDIELMSSVLSAINRAIEDPQKVMNFKKNANCLSVQAVRLENEIYRELGNPKSNSKRLLEIIKQCAQEKYKACHANGDSEETECLIAELKKLQPMEHFQSQILRKFICKILITPAGAVTIQLKNGAII